MSSLKELVYGNRSRRRFDGGHAIDRADLLDLVDLARMSPSGANKQWLRYALVNDPAQCSEVYETLQWAAYLKDWQGPAEGERPTGYIVIMEDLACGNGHPLDAGIAAQTIMLGAVEKGLGGCMIASINRKALAERLDLPDTFRIALVLALGRPVDIIQVESMPLDGDVKYWRSDDVHHVPKRTLPEIIFSKDRDSR